MSNSLEQVIVSNENRFQDTGETQSLFFGQRHKGGDVSLVREDYRNQSDAMSVIVRVFS